MRLHLVIIPVVVSTILGSSCASGASESGPTATTTTVAPSESSVTTSAPSATAPASSTEPTPASTSTSTSSAAALPTDVVVDAAGTEFDVLEPTATIVDLGFLSLDLAALGIDVAAVGYPPSVLGSITAELDDEVVDRLASPVAAITDGFVVPVEQLIALQPDLIVTTTFYATQFETELAALDDVVPVFLVDAELTWDERLVQIGALFGQQEAAAGLVAETAAMIDALADEIVESELGDATVSILRLGVSEAGGDFEAYVRPGLPSEIVRRVGWRQPEAQDVDGVDPDAQFPRIGVTYERAIEHDADVLIVLEIAGLLAADEALASPTVAALDAVGAGRVVRSSYLLWTSNSVLGVRAIVDDLRAAAALVR
jgi:ABC-type Fe3+-hydroxamate transport system substrate-binding protein